MKIYLASSWKNAEQMKRLALNLRNEGHKVDCFCDESSGRFVFDFSEIGPAENLNAINFLADDRSQLAFYEDKKWLDWCEVCVMCLPCGNSAHLEAGYAKGRDKVLIIFSGYFPPGEFDVMYGFADFITDDYMELLVYLGEISLT